MNSVAFIPSIFLFYLQVPEALWIEVTISSDMPLDEDSLIDELLLELLSDEEDELGFDDGEDEVEVDILPVTRTLCPTQFCRLTLPSGMSMYEDSLRAISLGVWLDVLIFFFLLLIFSPTLFNI